MKMLLRFVYTKFFVILQSQTPFIMTFHKKSFIVILLFFVTRLSIAQAQPLQLTTNIKANVIENLSASLLKNYIFSDTAIKMANFLKSHLKNKDYESITNPNEFAQKLTTDLLSVYRDIHLAVNYNPQLENVLKNTSEINSSQVQEQNLQNARQQNFGFKKIEILSGNIGYVYFDRFFGLNEFSKETISGVFSFLKHTNALVIDLRNNGGGSPDMVKYICSYFFKEKTHINNLYERRISKAEEYWTEPLSNSSNFPSLPLYILVNRRTFSAAEEFAYDLQSLHRATIIGETTGGGAHPVSAETIGNGFIGNIPYARAINPITGKNWEATGVKPDVQINADSSLDAAVLSYYDFQIKTLKDSNSIKTIKWSRDMLNAKLHPFSIDTLTLKTYLGNFADRIVSYENSMLYFTGRDGKKSKLIALTRTTFKIENTDNLKVEFLPTTTGDVSELAFIFDDGFVTTYKRK